MKAPDKIYIPKNIAPHLTEEWASHTHGSLDEYIRKDALIEWAKNWEWLGQSDDFLYAMDVLVQHLNSM